MDIRIPVRNTNPLRQYRMHPRGPQKLPVKRTHDPRRPPGSVARWLALRQQALWAATPGKLKVTFKALVLELPR